MTQSPRWVPAAVPSSEARGPSGGSILGEACKGAAAYPSQAAHVCPAWLGPQHQKPPRRTGAQEPRPLQTREGGWWPVGWWTPGSGHSLGPCGSCLVSLCGPRVPSQARTHPSLPEPQASRTCIRSAGWLCPARGWLGVGGTQGALRLPPWGSRYWPTTDQAAGRQVVAVGRRGLPFQPQRACNWIHQHHQLMRR